MTAPEDTAQIVDAALAQDLMQRLTDAMNSHRPEQVVALAQPDVLWEDPTIRGGHLVGHTALKDWLQTAWRAVPDFVISTNGPVHLAADGRSAMLEWSGVGTFTGPLEPPGLAPTGGQIRLSGIDRLWLKDGLLSHVRSVADMQALARQIGAAAPEDSRAEKLLVSVQRLTARRMRRRALRG